METKELSVIKPEEYGIEKKKASELIGNLPQILEERKELEKQFSEAIKMDIEDPESSKVAKRVRLLIQKNRTQGINVWHKTTKDYFLKGGQFVDAIKRKEAAVNERMENDLEQIEKYAEIQEHRRMKALQEKRVQEISKYVEDAHERNLAAMEDDVWSAYFQQKKKEYEDRIEAEKEAERQRIERERLDKIENDRRIEIAPFAQFITKNQDLREMPEKDYKALLSDLQKAKAEYDKEQERIRQENERLQKEREAAEKKAEAERKEHEAQLRKAREAREKAEAEIRAKREAEEKAAEEAEEKRKEMELAPDKDKLLNLVSSLEIEVPKCKSEDAEKVANEISEKFNAFKNWAKTKINEI